MRVIITRPRQQASSFAEALRKINAEVIFFPTIEIQPVDDFTGLDRALQRLVCYDWLVLTSANAVRVILERMAKLGVDALPENLRVAAVGPKTAVTLRQADIPVDFIPQKHIAEAILPGLGDLRGCWVLLPSAAIISESLPNAIQAAGGIAHTIAVYQTVPAQPDPQELAALRDGAEVLTFTSGSTVRNFCTLVRNAGLDPFNLPGKPQIACIGPKTAEVAQQLGFEVEIVADPHTTAGLVSAIHSQES